MEAWRHYADSRAAYLADAYRGGSLASVRFGREKVMGMQRRIHEIREMHLDRNTP